jgi:uncharacterized cupredoxin-like copper-binding protein
MRTKGILIAGVSLLVFVACGGGEPTGPTTGGQRVVRVQALDALAFRPNQVRVGSGETVRFVVTNNGQSPHEFILGPDHVQAAHQEAAGMGMEHGAMQVDGQLAALELEPGQTGEAVVTFQEQGSVIYGCHEPGHYKGGMRGTVTVS